MSQLLVDDIVNKDDTGAPGLSRGVVVTGITTSTSAVIGTGVTINSTGINVGAAVTINPTGVDAGAGIITATSFTGDGGNLTGLNIPAGYIELDGALFN